MSVTFALVGYSSADLSATLDSLVPMFTIESSELDWGTIGIAFALADCIEAGTITGWPDDLDPKGKSSGRLDLEVQYKKLYEECRAMLDWQTECNPGSFSNARFWVRVDFE